MRRLKPRKLRFDTTDEESALGLCPRVKGHLTRSSWVRDCSLILLSRSGKLIFFSMIRSLTWKQHKTVLTCGEDGQIKAWK